MSDENTTSDVGFKCDVNLFFEGVSNANAAKGSVRNTISTANSMSDIEGIGRVIAELNNCNIDALIGVIETARDSLLSLDSDFANQYFKLLQTYIKGLDPEALGDEYLAQYIASEKEYWTTLVAMLEKNEDSLSPYMKKQLDIARAMAGYYDATDKMGANDVSIDELKELYDERKNYEIDLLKINGLSGDALDKAIAELDEKYELAIAGAECNDAYKQALALDINDENYQDLYENFLEKQADYQIKLVESNKDLTDEEKEQLKAEINRKLEENKNIVGINVLSNELNKLNVTDKNYRDSAISLLEEQAKYQKQLIDLNTDLTDEEKAQLKAEINRKLVENKDVVRLNAVSNEFNNLDITAADYEKKSKSLLDLQKYYTKKIYRSDTSLTPEQLAKKLDEVDSQYESIYLAVESAKIQSDLDILNAKIEEYEKDPKGYKNDPKNSGEDPDKYEETRLTLLNNFRGCTEEQLKLAGLTQTEIDEQLKVFDVEIAKSQENIEWNEMNVLEKFGQYVTVAEASVVCGDYEVIENAFDGLAMLYGKVFNKEEKVAELVKTDVTEEVYAKWMKFRGINDNAAYSKVHDVSTGIGSFAGYTGIALLSLFPGGTVVSTAIGTAAAAGSASERALNSGATYDNACWAGGVAGTLALISGVLSGGLAAGMKGKIYNSIIELGIDALKGTGIAVMEPIINPIAEYLSYAKESKDADGNLLYDDLGDYYKKSGAIKNIFIGAGVGFASTTVRGLTESNKAKLEIFKNENNKYLDSLTPEERTKAWNDYFSNAYGDAFEGKFSGSGLETPSIDIPQRTYDLNGNPIYYMDPNDSRSGYNFGVRKKVYISSYEKTNALASFEYVMKTGEPSNQEALDIFYNVFKDGMDNGDEEALKVIRRITEIKQKNPNFIIKSIDGRSCWSISQSAICIDINEPISKGTLCHELGHALYDTGLNGELPDNWNSIILDTRWNAQKNSKLRNSVLNEVQLTPSKVSHQAEQEFLKYLPFDTMDEFEDQLTKQYQQTFEKTPIGIAKALRKQNYDWKTIYHVITGKYDARELAKMSIKSELDALSTKIFDTQYGDVTAISDIYDAVYDGTPFDNNVAAWGHGSAYYKKVYALGYNNRAFHEMIANFTQLKLTGNDASLYSIKALYGDEFYKTLEDTFNNMVLGDLK